MISDTFPGGVNVFGKLIMKTIVETQNVVESIETLHCSAFMEGSGNTTFLVLLGPISMILRYWYSLCMHPLYLDISG